MIKSNSVNLNFCLDIGVHFTFYNSAMKDENKAKEQLIDELVELRQKIREFETLHSEHKMAKDGLQESEDKFRKISDTANDAIIIIDDDGKIYFWNKTAEDIFTYKSHEVMGRDLQLIIPERYREAHREGFNRFVRTGEKRIIGKRLELMAIRKDKTEFPVELSLSAIKIKGRWNAIGIIRDITTRKKMEEDLRKSREELSEKVRERTIELASANEKLRSEIKERIGMHDKLIRSEKLAAIGKIVGSISHDLRNPLNIIDNSSSFLSEILKNEEGVARKQLDIIHRAVKRANNIVTDILESIRIRPLCLEKCKVADIIREALLNIETPHNITVETHSDEDIPDILLDSNQIQRVFFNLISNAFRAMPEGGNLTITTRHLSLVNSHLSEDRKQENGDDTQRTKYEGKQMTNDQLPMTKSDFIEIAFSDTGVGIKEENLKKIYEPLFTTRSKGIGFGMVIVKDIIEKHHGTINVESEVGKGTTFTIALPVGIDDR